MAAGAALLVSLLGLGASPAPADEVAMARRRPLVLYLRVSAAAPDLPGALFAAVDRRLRRESELYPRAPEPSELAVLESCTPGQRLSCWSGTLGPGAVWLLALSAHRAAGGTELSALLVPVRSAQELLERARYEGAEGWRERVEEQIFARTPGAGVLSCPEDQGEALARCVDRLLDELRAPLALVPGRFGRILVLAPGRAGPVALDGEPVGALVEGRLSLAELAPGGHRVRVPQEEIALVVEGGRTSTAAFTAPSPERSPWFFALLGAGAVAVAAGGVTVAYAAGLEGEDLRGACLRGAGASGGCPALGAPGFGWSPERAPGTDPSAINGGPAVAPLGLALLAMGTGWLVASLWQDGEEPPWAALGLGLVGGAVVYGAGLVVYAR